MALVKVEPNPLSLCDVDVLVAGVAADGMVGINPDMFVIELLIFPLGDLSWPVFGALVATTVWKNSPPKR